MSVIMHYYKCVPVVHENDISQSYTCIAYDLGKSKELQLKTLITC